MTKTRTPRARWAFVLDPEIGEPGRPTQCALAQHAKDYYPDLGWVHFGINEIRFTLKDSGDRLIWKTPAATTLAMQAFDKGVSRNPHALVLKRDEAKVVPKEHPSRKHASDGVSHRKQRDPSEPAPKRRLR